MKKILLAVALTVVMTSAAFAAGNARNNVGCGLGTILWENKADNSSLFQAFQATTNGTSGNQTFGVTSGTSECKQPSKFVQNERLIHFVQANMDNLAKDIAMGKGETLDTFAEMLGVAPAETVAFNSKLQANFSKIFTSENVVLAEVIDNSVAVANN
jgi:opacity protein-like surface antigen